MTSATSPFGLDRQELESLVATALEEAGDRGADQAEAGASLGTGLSVMVRCGEVETLEHQRDRSFAVTVYFDKRKGHASTSDLSVAAIRATVGKACSIAGYTTKDDCAGLADAKMMATENLPTLRSSGVSITGRVSRAARRGATSTMTATWMSRSRICRRIRLAANRCP